MKQNTEPCEHEWDALEDVCKELDKRYPEPPKVPEKLYPNSEAWMTQWGNEVTNSINSLIDNINDIYRRIK